MATSDSAGAAPASQPSEDGPGAWKWPAALFVALFAFLLASFPDRNVNLWGHLAAGRALATGQPFPVEAPGLPVHRNWAFNVGLYALHQAVGGTGLVLGKALLVACLA